MKEIAGLQKIIAEQEGLDELLGVEGRAARVYFNLFGRMLLCDFDFDGRRKRPPPDPVNALLSLTYTMVFNEIASLLDGLGFDPYLGFLHSSRYGRASLAADLMEEFRAPVADRFVLNFVNRKMVTSEDFVLDPLTGGCHLRKQALKTFFNYWDKWLREPRRRNLEAGGGGGFRCLFRQQAEAAMAAVSGKSEYKPYLERT